MAKHYLTTIDILNEVLDLNESSILEQRSELEKLKKLIRELEMEEEPYGYILKTKLRNSKLNKL